MYSIDEARQSDYHYIAPIDELYKSDKPIISVIVDCYYKLDLIKQAIQSVLSQSYCNVELVLIDNGAESDISSYIKHIYDNYNNTSIIKFNENQFSWKDTQRTVVICWNAGVLHAKGEIVGHLNYDDMISKNFCSRMARLFIENNNCITAGPLPISIDIDGNFTDENFNKLLESSNCRPRYIDGKELAIDYITGNPKRYFGSPGGVLFTKKDVLIQYGGFDRASDTTQIIKLAIHGESGFDPKAKLFWRHHDGQLNRVAKRKGVVWCSELQNVVKNESIIEIWERLFTQDQVKLLHKFIKNLSRENGSSVAIEALRNKEIIVFFRVIRNIANNCPYFLFYVLWFSLLEVLKMFYEKVSNIVGYK